MRDNSTFFIKIKNRTHLSMCNPLQETKNQNEKVLAHTNLFAKACKSILGINLTVTLCLTLSTSTTYMERSKYNIYSVNNNEDIIAGT